MGFQVQVTEGDKWEVVLLDEPSYIHALKMAPETMEPELGTGTWLVVAFPVWSGPVRHSVLAAVTCAKQYGGKFHLGVRPFESHEEMSRWWPVDEVPVEGEMSLAVQDDPHRREVHITTDTSTDPAWLVLKDGQVVHQGAGPRSAEQLGEMMHGIVQ